MKNICFLNTTDFWGGGEKLHLEYALGFINRGYNVFIAAKAGSPLYEKAAANNIKLFDISLRNLSFLNFSKRDKLSEFFKNEEIDTLIFSASTDAKAGSFAAKKAALKNIVYLRGLAVPVKNSFVNRIIFRDIITHIIANSEETRKTILVNLGKSINIGSKVKVIYHGIDLEEFDEYLENQSYTLEKDAALTIGNAGRLTEQKRQKDLLKVASALKKKGLKCNFLIAGAGELKQDLEEQINNSELVDSVKLMGFQKDMISFMKNIDIFVLTSGWEGFGYVLVEAMAASKPVVAYDISSNPEIIKDGINGFLVKFPDVEMLTEKIEVLLRSREKREEFGTNGRLMVEKRFRLQDRVIEMENYLLEESQ